MYKLVLSETGANFLTNDSFTILSRIKLDHPLAQVIAGAGVDAARSAGGGSTTTIILASEILNALLSLLKMGYKPSTLLRGCTLAYSRVRKTSSASPSSPKTPCPAWVKSSRPPSREHFSRTRGRPSRGLSGKP